MPLLMPAVHARTPFILLMRLLFPTLGNPEGSKTSIQTTNFNSKRSKPQKHELEVTTRVFTKGNEQLTGDAHFERHVRRVLRRQADEELREARAPEAGGPSGPVQHRVGGHDPSLPGSLVKTKPEKLL